MKLAHPELLGALMKHVKIFGRTPKAGCGTQQQPVAGFINCASEKLGIDEAFQEQDRMAVVFQPIVGKPLLTQTERSTAQVGQLSTVNQNQEAAILGAKGQAAAALILLPTEPMIPRGQMPSRSTPAQQGQPLVAIYGHITELLSDKRGIVQVMMFTDQLIPTGLFLWKEQQLDAQFIEHLLFIAHG